MKWKTIRIGICAFACLVLPLYLAIADTLVNGAVRGHWTVEEGPYFAFESIYLDYNDTLIIDPGVEVKFGSQTRFDVHGVLIAVGTEEDSIIFRPLSNELGDWYWLKIEESNASESRLSYCKIVLSQWGLSLFESEPIITNCRISNHLNACVRFEASRAQILNSTICHSGHDGIMIAENSRAVIRHCYIFDCGSDGIAARTGSNPVIDGVTVSSCRNHGINLSDAGPCSLKYNRIIECSENGIRIFISAATKLYRNIIYECNGDEGIYLNNCRDALILNNTIVNNSGIGLSLISSTSSVINNIITQSGHDGIFVRGGELIQLQFNDVWASGRYDYSGTRAGYGDINENPMLVDPAEGDFHPQEGSPVIDAGCPDYEDPDGTRSDMGVEFFNQNRPPVINRYWPVDLERFHGDRELSFGVEATDEDGHDLFYSWFVNRRHAGNESTITYLFDYNRHVTVRVIVDDHHYYGETTHEWDFEVYGSDVPNQAQDQVLPERFQLGEPYPNPFNETARFRLDTVMPGEVCITVFDLNGREIAQLWQGWLDPGRHDFSINAAQMPVGISILVAETNGMRSARKLVVIK